jgi:gentisate 1,2-dioxygenase
VRMVVEGEGAYTTVDGEKCPMLRGDLILTPTGLWHEHGHDGTDPVIWLDVLDLPLMYYAEVSYHVNGSRQEIQPGHGEQRHAHGGLLPTPMFERGQQAYPVLRYPWGQARAALLAMAADNPSQEHVQVTYVNPQTGGDAENVLGFYALMLKPGQTLKLPARSPAQVFHVIEGGMQLDCAGATHAMVEADTACTPGYEAATLTNARADQPCFVFMADESPLHRKLGVYEVRG